MDWYLAFKTLHLIAMVTWFAGLFYLPRLFAYHVSAPTQAQPMLCIMERRLANLILRPSILLVWLGGLAMLLINPAWLQSGWIHAKLTLILILSAYHGSLVVFVKKFAANQNTRSAKFYKWYNEVPSLILILVIILAVFKPF